MIRHAITSKDALKVMDNINLEPPIQKGPEKIPVFKSVRFCESCKNEELGGHGCTGEPKTLGTFSEILGSLTTCTDKRGEEDSERKTKRLKLMTVALRVKEAESKQRIINLVTERIRSTEDCMDRLMDTQEYDANNPSERLLRLQSELEMDLKELRGLREEDYFVSTFEHAL